MLKKKIWNGIVTTLLIGMLVIAAGLFVPKLVGLEPLIVLSGSMEPEYPVGSVVYVREVDTDSIQVGDNITFHLTEDTLVTHRVVQVNEDGTFETKGDANEQSDGTPVEAGQIIGSPLFAIPFLGYLADELGSVSGKILYVTLLIVLVILMYMGDLLWNEEEREENRDEADTKRR